MTVTSTTTSSTIFLAQSGTSVDGGQALSTDTMLLTTSTETDATGDSGGLGLELLGDAVAAGEDTFAGISASGTGTDAGGVVTVLGTVSAEAAAASPDGAFASTATWIGLLGDADVVFALNYSASSTDQTASGTTATSSSTAVLFAMAETGGPGSYVAAAEPETVEPVLDEAPDACGCADITFELDGNIAVFDVDLAAFGDDTLVTVDVTAFAVEDQLSSVTVAAILALD